MSNETRGDEEGKTKEDHIESYFREMVSNDLAMEPFRDHAKALKQNYEDNEWLTRAEMSMILKAYRAHKSDLDVEDLQEKIEMVKRNIDRIKV